jgi:putative ABC transport system permease protein
MIKNYCKIAWRNIMKNKFSSFVNIFGLAVGLTCCMLISLYLYYEFSYDKHNRNASRLYQVGTHFHSGEKNNKSPGTPSPMAPALQQEFPEIEKTARLLNLFVDDKTLLQYVDATGSSHSFFETKGFMADSSFFQLFDYHFIEGDPHASLMQPNTIVLSEEIAQKIFGNTPALDKMIHVNSNTNGPGDYRVTGVFRPGNEPTSIDARFFLSLSSPGFGNYVRTTTDFASNNMFFTYLLLKEGTDAKALQAKMPAFVEKYMRKDLAAAGFNKEQFLVPIKDLHLRAGFDSDVIKSGNLVYLYILGSVALFILLIACINFMNLATARSAKRAAEVGIRKVLGAEKRQLLKQFFGEAMLLALFSFMLALLMVQLLLPSFSRLSGLTTYLSLWNQPLLVLGFISLAIVTGFVAGIYPALYLSAFRPIKVLKGRFINSLAAVTFRKALVTFQFAISAVLIIAVIAIGKQMKYMRDKDLGFDREQQLVIPLRSDNAKNIYTALKTELARNNEILSVGASFYYPGIFNPSDMSFYVPSKSVNEAVNLKMNYADRSFMQTLDIKPVAGRLFSEEFPADTNYRIVVNEMAIKKLGFQDPAAAVGQQVVFDWRDSSYKFEIIGVVKDFNFEGLKEPIGPFAFQTVNSSFNYIIAHLQAGDPGTTLQRIATTWKGLNPNEPFEYSFLDDDFQKNYKAENRLSALVRYFMTIAICLCCLGLLGLVTFSAEQRTKEIGIRKVLGSSVPNIIGLLSKDFLKLVLLGNLIAIPIAWFIMNKWIQDFAYRTTLAWWLFALGAFASLAIAMLTLSFQAIKAAVANPIKSLRTE